MRGGHEGTERGNGRGRASWGCATAGIAVLALATWMGCGFVVWKQCRIPLPNGAGSVIYMARLRKIFCAEWNRQVCLETGGFQGKCSWIPGDSGGAWPVKVYYYPAVKGVGPYLRFVDPVSEYAVDLGNGTTLLLRRRVKGGVYGVPLTSSWPRRGSATHGATGATVETIGGRPLRRLGYPLGRGPGTYIGRVEYPFNCFSPVEDAREEPLPHH